MEPARPTPAPFRQPDAPRDEFVAPREWVTSFATSKLDVVVGRFMPDPGGMYQLVPPSVRRSREFRASGGGKAIEYGLKESLELDWRSPLEHIDATAQNVPGGRGDFQLSPGFQRVWGDLGEWDVTTPGQMERKISQGKDRNPLLYAIPWSQVNW